MSRHIFPFGFLFCSSADNRAGRALSKQWSIAKRRSDAGMPAAVKPGCPVAGNDPPWFIAALTATPVGILSFGKTTNTRAQPRHELRINHLVRVRCGRIKAAGEMAWEMIERRSRFVRIAHDDDERGVVVRPCAYGKFIRLRFPGFGRARLAGGETRLGCNNRDRI